MNTAQDVQIRPCTAADLDSMRHVGISSFCHGLGYDWKDGGHAYADQFFSLKNLQAGLRKPSMLNYLCLYREKPTGWLRLQLKKDTLWIDKLYVLPEYMGRGLGKQLLSFTEQLAAIHAVDSICLYTREHSPAWHFYHNKGFRTEDVSQFKHSGFKEGFIPRAQMIKNL